MEYLGRLVVMAQDDGIMPAFELIDCGNIGRVYGPLDLRHDMLDALKNCRGCPGNRRCVGEIVCHPR